MTTYRMLRTGDNLFPYNQGSMSNKDRDKAINNMQLMMPYSVVKLEDFECDCAEKIAAQDTFTKSELIQIMRCPVRH